MADRNDNGWLGLSLGSGSGCGATESPLFFNLMQRPSQPVIHNTTSWTRMFRLSDRREAETRSFHRGFIDVNRAADVEDENGVSSPNSTVSSLSGKRSEREVIAGEENEGERNSWSSRGGSDDEDGGNGDMSSRKKLRLTKEQSMQLEDKFNRHSSLNTREKQELAQQLNLRPRQVEVWFQNRRARTKLKQTEVDCEELRTCVDNLTKENARLRKEVEELRKLKLSPESSMHMSPPTTLTMCPQCQLMGVSSSSSSAAAATTSTVSATAPTSQQEKHTIHRPVPISPWAALLNPQYRPVEAPATGL